jgi:hypothetical protein
MRPILVVTAFLLVVLVLDTIPVAPSARAQAGAATVIAASSAVPATLKPFLNLTVPNLRPGAMFGYSIAMGGGLVIVSAPSETFAGVVYVFNSQTGVLVSILAPPNPLKECNCAGDFFGRSVAVSGNLVVVGEDFDKDIVGHAYVFDAQTGVLLSTLTSPNTQAFPLPPCGGCFGHSVAISGNLVVVGAPSEFVGNVTSGQAYAFNAQTGALLATLTNPNLGLAYGPDNLGFGYSVGLSGSTAVVGAYGDGYTLGGMAFLFNAESGKLLSILGQGSPEQSRGFAVAISGNLAIVRTSNPERLETFDATNGSLTGGIAEPSAGFGLAVGTGGDAIIAGSPSTDVNNASSVGQAYLYNASTRALISIIPSPNPTRYSCFPCAVATDGSVAAVSDGTRYTFVHPAGPGQVYLYRIGATATSSTTTTSSTSATNSETISSTSSLSSSSSSGRSPSIPEFPFQLGFTLLVTVIIAASYVVARRVTVPRY